MTRTAVLWTILFAFGLFAGTGCKSDCQKLADKYQECEDEKASDKEIGEFVEKCEKNEDGDKIKTQLDCMSKNDSCDDFKKCVKDARKAAYFKEELEELKGKVEKGDIDDAKYTCARWMKDAETKDNADVKTICADVLKKVSEGKLEKIKEQVKKGEFSRATSDCKYALEDEMFKDDADIKKYCEELPKLGIKALTDKVTKLRDEGAKDTFDPCYKLKDLAKKAGADHEKKAELLCREAKAASQVKEVAAKVAETLKTDAPNIPWTCKNAITELQKIDTEWSKKQIPTVAKKCYAELGAKILELRTKERFCSSVNDKVIIEAFDKYKFDDAKLTELVNAVKEGRCKGK